MLKFWSKLSFKLIRYCKIFCAGYYVHNSWTPLKYNRLYVNVIFRTQGSGKIRPKTSIVWYLLYIRVLGLILDKLFGQVMDGKKYCEQLLSWVPVFAPYYLFITVCELHTKFVLDRVEMLQNLRKNDFLDKCLGQSRPITSMVHNIYKVCMVRV